MLHAGHTRHITVLIGIAIVAFGIAVGIGVARPFGAVMSDRIAVSVLTIALIVMVCARVIDDGPSQRRD